jgi:(p)ppGpp synthase/HD superfamily hydrolase
MSTPEDYTRHRIALYYWLLGAKFFRAARAMSWAEGFHNGKRKDGVLPEFSHQVWIANFLRTLPLPAPLMEDCLVAAFLHDVCEDKDVGFGEIASLFGVDAGDHVERLSKKHRGVVVPAEVYFARLAESVVSALVKGVDRAHNLGSMTGVFSLEKQKAYIEETRACHLPMLKIARRRFPEHEAAFENIKQILLSHTRFEVPQDETSHD